MPKSKVSAFLSVLLVFASGAAMGAVGYRLYVVKTVVSPVQAKKKTSPEEFRKLATAKLKDAVKLTDQQLIEVQKIYDWQGDQFMQVNKKYQAQTDQIHRDAEHDGEQIHEASVAKVKAILTPEQMPLYEKWLADRDAAHKKHQLERQQQGQGQGPHNKDGRRPPLP